MGKRNRTEEDGKQSPSTIFVSSLPDSFTKAQLEETFSDVGPIRHCFLVMQKGSNVHRGFGYVRFAATEDAKRAAELKNGASVGGKRIAVKLATYRQPLEKRLKTNQVNAEDVKDEKISDALESGIYAGDSAATEDCFPVELVDFEKETETALKVFKTLSTGKGDLDSKSEDSALPPSNELTTTIGKAAVEVKPKWPGKTKLTEHEIMEEQQRTVFLQNLPSDTNYEEVKRVFGKVQSFLPVLDKVTGLPRGTGFLKFSTPAEADAAVAAAHDSDIFLKGRQLTVLKVLDKKSAQDKKLEKAKSKDVDQRNLYLAKEGVILEGSAAAEGVSAKDMLTRQELEKKKNVKLQSPNFHVSRTRLIVYNMPKTVSEKQLKKIFVGAVLSRASKQTPVIRQIKILNEAKNAKVTKKAFIEFTEHQHAVVALRVLNNNPETFGPERRPIVQFALENIQKLRQRQKKLAYRSTEKPKEKQSSRLDRKSAAAPEPKSKEDAETVQKNRKFQGGINLKQQIRERKFPNKTTRRSKIRGDEVADKLDVLIEQYKSKFSQRISHKTAGEKKQGSRQLKRWFS